MEPKIPFNKPFITGNEGAYILQAISRGNIAADGPFTRKCARLLEDRFGVSRILMTPSCTAALEIAALLCDVAPGDEVLMPSFTFCLDRQRDRSSGCEPGICRHPFGHAEH